MNNNDIRMMARNQDVRLWQIADKLKCYEKNYQAKKKNTFIKS